MWDMIIKERHESKELMILRSLNARMDLAAKELNHYLNLEKGFIGEKKFDKLIEKENFFNDWLIVNDLLMEHKSNFFQIDSVLISQETIYLIDVKNFEGDFYLNGDLWYMISNHEIKNPLEQLKRSESLFRRFIQNFGFNYSIKAYLVFINPEFYLYQAPLNQSMIFPTQLNRFIKNLNNKRGKISDRHKKLADFLVSKHIAESPFMQIPTYSYDQFKKGFWCKHCDSFLELNYYNKLVCNKCGCEEDIDSAVLRNVEEYRLLFPDRKITLSDIEDWCKEIKSKKMIRRILTQNYKAMKHSRSTYYV
jgi:hypothetical protein